MIAELHSAEREYGYNIQLGGLLTDSRSKCGAFQDLTGREFKDLVVISRESSVKLKSGRTITNWKCECSCGNIVILNHEQLLRKNRTDCGCKRKEKAKVAMYQRYIRNRHFEFFNDYYIYHFGKHKLIFDLKDYDRTKDLIFSATKYSFYYKTDFFSNQKFSIKTLFNIDNKEFIGEKFDYRKSNFKDKHKKVAKIPHKKAYHNINRNMNCIPVNQFDKEHNLIASYNSVSTAADVTGLQKGNITSCCKKRSLTSGGFIWEYKYPDQVCMTLCDTPIYQLNLDTTVYKVYENITEASKLTGISINTLYAATVRKSHFSSGYLWTKEGDNKVKPYKRKRQKPKGTSIPVCQMDINNNIIDIFKSINSVTKLLNIDNSDIGRCCEGKRKFAGGFKWKYLVDIKESDISDSFLLEKYNSYNKGRKYNERSESIN